jgi:hypothetical protein
MLSNVLFEYKRFIMKTAGYVILVLGLLLTIFTTFKFFTREKVLDVGPLSVTKEEPHTFNWSPLLGIGVIAVGAVLIWQGSKKR